LTCSPDPGPPPPLGFKSQIDIDLSPFDEIVRMWWTEQWEFVTKFIIPQYTMNDYAEVINSQNKGIFVYF
jgi:hypothetical protein